MSDAGVVVSDLNHGVTPADLANSLVGSAVTISNITYTGSPRAAGTFTGGLNIVGFDSGIILNSGAVQTISGDPPCSVGVEGPNTCFELSGPDGWSNSSDFGLPGDPDLTTLSGNPTFDATILEFDFVPQFSTVQFRYVFSSEEYSDYSNTQYNDVFAFYINGVNVALVPGTNEPVSINTINNGNDNGGDPTPHHPEFFIDNVRPSVTIDTQMDGLTVVLTISATVNPGEVNHMKLAIADASDGVFDSAVFIQARSLISGTAIETSLTDGVQHAPIITVPQGTAVWDTAQLEGVNSDTATGTVTYKVFSDENCTTLYAIAGTKTVTNGQVPDSDPIVFNQIGTFYWQASYSGDDQHNPVTSSCDDERVTVTPAAVQLISAVSRKTHTGAGNFDTPLPLTGTPGIECRTGGATNDYTMVVTFSGNVTVTGSPQAQVTSGTGCVGTSGGCTGNVNVNGNTVTVPLTNIANAQTINVVINGVNNAAYVPATDFTIPMSILIGDTNGNGTVNAADVAQTKGRLGQTVGPSNFRSDVSTNGSINAADTALIKGHLGTGLP